MLVPVIVLVLGIGIVVGTVPVLEFFRFFIDACIGKDDVVGFYQRELQRGKGESITMVHPRQECLSEPVDEKYLVGIAHGTLDSDWVSHSSWAPHATQAFCLCS